MQLGFNGATTQISHPAADAVHDVDNIPRPQITDRHCRYPGDGVITVLAILRTFRHAVELFVEEFWRHDSPAVAREARAGTEAVRVAAGRNA